MRIPRLAPVIIVSVLALAACGPAAPVEVTTGGPETGTTTPAPAVTTSEPAPTGAAEPTTEGASSSILTPVADAAGIPELFDADGTPIEVTAWEVSELRDGVEGEDYRVVSRTLDATTLNSEIRDGVQLTGLTCEGYGLGIQATQDTVILGRIGEDGELADTREVTLPETDTGMDDRGFAVADDGTTVWVRDSLEGWWLFAADPGASEARVLGSSETTDLTRGAAGYPTGTSVLGEDVLLGVCEGTGGGGPCGGLWTVPLAGGELAELGDDLWWRDTVAGGIVYRETLGEASSAYSEGDWVLRTVSTSPDEEGVILLTGTGPEGFWVPSIDAELADGTAEAVALGYVDGITEPGGGSAVLVEDGAARAWVLDAYVNNLRLTESHLLLELPSKIVVIPRDGAEPWSLDVAEDAYPLLAGRPCGDIAAVNIISPAEPGSELLVLDLGG